MPEAPRPPKPKARLYDLTLDQKTIGHLNPNVAHERDVAIFDLLENNSFEPSGFNNGPYNLVLSIAEDRLIFEIGNEEQDHLKTHMLSLTPLKKLIKDYFLVCDTYYEAIRTASTSRIQAIDMGRKALHDEGTGILVERLNDKIDMDFDTARRLFTLICALHWKG